MSYPLNSLLKARNSVLRDISLLKYLGWDKGVELAERDLKIIEDQLQPHRRETSMNAMKCCCGKDHS